MTKASSPVFLESQSSTGVPCQVIVPICINPLGRGPLVPGMFFRCDFMALIVAEKRENSPVKAGISKQERFCS